MNLQPLDDRILVQRVQSEEKTAGGILLPDTAKEKPQKGKVVATGPGKLNKDGKRAAMQVKVGDTILLHSDGLVENRGPAGEKFPMHKVQHVLQHLMPAEDNLKALITSAEAVWQGQPLDDDVTILLLRIVAKA